MSDQGSSHHSKDEIDYSDPSEAQAVPQVVLPEVPKVTGEENEDCIFKIRAKMYRFRDDQWKERGIGIVKLLRHKVNNKVRMIMRQEKTLKPVANFISKLTLH